MNSTTPSTRRQAPNPHHGLGEVPELCVSRRAADIDALTTIMKTVAVHGDGKQALAVLRFANGDPRVFAAAGPELRSQLVRPGCDRRGWSETLSQVWDRHLVSSTESSLHRELASVAMAIDDWGLARRMLECGMATHGETATDLALLASCEAQTGQLHKACALAARALANDPEHFQANDVARHLLARAGRFDNLWCRRVSLPGIPVALEPLDVDHAEAFFLQYRDPQIAEMTRLREFANVDEVRTWIHRMNSARNRHRYAVMHEDAGFVGYVSLRPSGLDAHFGFWIGTEHQGGGFGTHAGVLLCEFARYRGIEHVFAAVFDHNWRSIRALERIGFRSIPLRPADEEDRRIFMCYSRADDLAVETAFRDCLHREQRDLELVDANGRPDRLKEGVQ